MNRIKTNSEGRKMQRLRYIPRHNWQEIGERQFQCKDCTAELDQSKGVTIYTPGNGDCDD